jgi:probable rRNA maturation factor
MSVHNTRINFNASKAKAVELDKLSEVFLKYLSKNQHFIGVKEVAVNLTLCGKTRIKSLNREYRSKDKVTDVLSFGVHENLRPDFKRKIKNPPVINLGDIFICREVAEKQAMEFGISDEQEILHLAIHGFLHLLGFDHEISLKEEKIMELEEAHLVNTVYKKLGYKK